MAEFLPLHRREAAVGLEALRRRIRWKPKKAASHLEKRKFLEHLPVGTSLEEYNNLIQSLAQEDKHQVYLYRFGSERYYAVRGTVRNREWLLIFTKKGVVETAFPPDNMDGYLSRRGFIFIGTVQEVLA